MSKLSSKQRNRNKRRKAAKEYSTLEIRTKLKYSVIRKMTIAESKHLRSDNTARNIRQRDHILIRNKLRILCFKYKLIEHPENFPEAQQELRVYIVQNRKTYIDRLI